MDRIQQELEKITTALREPHSSEYDQLYAAQQALSWAIEPGGFKSPYNMITGTPADSEGYSAPSHLPQS